MQTVSEDLKKALGLSVDKGVYISQVVENSPAEKAGLKEGDIIVEVEGVEVTSAAELASIIHNYTPNSVVTIKVNRKGKVLNFKVTLGKAENVEYTVETREFAGLIVRDLTSSRGI